MNIAETTYIPNKGKPRVVFLIQGTGVIYGTGGDKHLECCISTFKRWIRKTKAVPSSEHEAQDFSLEG